MNSRYRSGSLLIIVAGLATILLAVATSLLVRVRSDAGESTQVVHDTQARVMLIAALSYLQESSRLGWAPEQSSASDATGFDHEAFGWTDIRDGSIGPRTVRSASGAIASPAWYRGLPLDDGDGNPFNTYSPGSDPVTDPLTDADLPPSGSRTWPCPGSVCRVDAFTWQRPPHAIRLDAAPNPYGPQPSDTRWQTFLSQPVPRKADGNVDWGDYNNEMRSHWDAYSQYLKSSGVGRLDPQPIADDHASFVAGDRTVVGSSAGLGWFRVYRELPSDHDNDGDPWYDRVPLTGHGTFIIAVGGGGTRGFRFWDRSDSGWNADLEPVTASESGLFGNDELMFRELQKAERVMWYRAEWTGAQGGGAHARVQYGAHIVGNYTDGMDIFSQMMTGINQRVSGGGGNSGQITQASTLSFFGAWKWIQRLEREPDRW